MYFYNWDDDMQCYVITSVTSPYTRTAKTEREAIRICVTLNWRA